MEKEHFTQLANLVPLKLVAELLPSEQGKRIHRKTLIRWIHHGVRGVKLRAKRINGRCWGVSLDELHRFLAAVTARSQEPRWRQARRAVDRKFGRPPIQPPSDVDRRLDKEGL